MFPMKKKNLFLFFISIINLNLITFNKSNQIIFTFKTESINVESSKYIEAISDNKIYITTEIGQPSQKINMYLTTETDFFIIADSSIDSSYFNKEESKTYLNTSDINTFYLQLFSKAYYANENFSFQTSIDNSNKKTYNNVEFIHAIEFSNNNKIASGYFGLQLQKKNNLNIFNCLKSINAISSYVWYLKYTTDSEGYLAIGEFPPEYNNTEALRKSNPLPCTDDNSDSLCWYLQFVDINFGDIKLIRDRKATISPELGFIVGTNEYKIKIEENYFDKTLKNQCTLKLSDNNYYYYECDKNTDISSFKDLTFSNQEFMYDFVLTKDDLFKVYGDKLYFLIVFDKYTCYGKNWRLGKPFIKKYTFLFNTDSKLIYFYSDKEKDSSISNKGESNVIYWIIIGILGLCVIIMVALVLYKVFFKPKKKKANELKEDIDYTNADKNENALGV